MAKEKFYGVKVGKNPGIYKTWPECQKQVAGYPGALFKSFFTEAEAQEYAYGNLSNTVVIDQSTLLPGEHYDIYVDGSYFNQRYSWAFVVYSDSELIHQASGVGEDLEAAGIRNVAGELEAAVMAVKWAETQAIKSITIHHDYIGISEWATGKWKANNKITKAYSVFIQPYLSWVKFNKVSGHSGNAGNELADKLAGQALKSV